MEDNSLNELQLKLNNYKYSHPYLFIIFNNYIEEKKILNNIFFKNLDKSIENLENIEDLTSQQVLLIYLNNI